ncbi:hypothetical protein HPP92_023762 [Vanilla planifolia]|uniref:Uncharacterized protein n=1 Tax=Vanilla planifolia TaxID=51239 RepID=A0A835PMC3_VANPL|nr:hypothetical protein HPP92_024104 [Vanilla planifolia]KAG0455974.1 hypothetical protein HPP92_023762 [Vanilla planifolia]
MSIFYLENFHSLHRVGSKMNNTLGPAIPSSVWQNAEQAKTNTRSLKVFGCSRPDSQPLRYLEAH